MALITMEDIERISPIFQGERGHKLANKLLRWTGIDQLAERYARHEDLQGPDFVDAYLKDLDVNYEIGGLEHLKSLSEGPFITISNHPYGGLDGLVLIDLIGHFRSDFKVMANKFLSMVKTIKDSFISVVPLTDGVGRQHPWRSLSHCPTEGRSSLGLVPCRCCLQFPLERFQDLRPRVAGIGITPHTEDESARASHPFL